MECLWEKSPRTAREITEALTRQVGWSRSTVLTLLYRMEDKHQIRCCSQDSVKTDSPILPREEAVLDETQSFLDRVYRGSISMMVSAFTRKQPLSPKEIEELYAILEEAKSTATDS
jgi:BlaI family penicillinase repressor